MLNLKDCQVKIFRLMGAILHLFFFIMTDIFFCWKASTSTQKSINIATHALHRPTYIHTHPDVAGCERCVTSAVWFCMGKLNLIVINEAP